MFLDFTLQTQSGIGFLAPGEVQSIMLGTVALIILIVGTIVIIKQILTKDPSKYEKFEVTKSQRELLELLSDVKSVPKNQLKNLISSSTLKKDIEELKKKNYIEEKVENDGETHIIIK